MICEFSFHARIEWMFSSLQSVDIMFMVRNPRGM
jgi:hypothetical protein